MFTNAYSQVDDSLILKFEVEKEKPVLITKVYLDWDYYHSKGKYPVDESNAALCEKYFKVFISRFNEEDTVLKVFYYENDILKDKSYYSFEKKGPFRGKIDRITCKTPSDEVFSYYDYDYDFWKEEEYHVYYYFKSAGGGFFLSDSTTFTWEDKMTYHTKFSEDGSVIFKESFHYDKKDRVNKIRRFHHKDNRKTITELYYDGNRVEIEILMTKRRITLERIDYKYDYHGYISLLKKAVFANGKLHYIETTHYGKYMRYKKTVIEYYNKKGVNTKTKIVRKRGGIQYFDKNGHEISFLEFKKL